MKTIRMEDMSWVDIKEAINQGFRTVVVALGAIEQHGPHMPTKTDALIGDVLAHRVALKLKNALHAATIRVGQSDHHLAFPGTISCRPSTLKAIITDYVRSFAGQGFKAIIFLPFHGGDFPPTQEAVEDLQQKHRDLKIIAYTDGTGFITALTGCSLDVGIPKEIAGLHAGETETSMMLALAEELVVKDRLSPGYLGPMGETEAKLINEKGIGSVAEDGYFGDPSQADPKRGNIYLEKMTDFLAREIEKLL